MKYNHLFMELKLYENPPGAGTRLLTGCRVQYGSRDRAFTFPAGKIRCYRTLFSKIGSMIDDDIREKADEVRAEATSEDS